MSDQPAQSKANGLTAQYLTLARALGAAAGIMEDDLEDLQERGMPHSDASLWLESRYITVTVLSAALAEALANAILSMSLPTSEIKNAIEARVFAKWKTSIPRAIGCESILSDSLERELKALLKARNSIVHAKPRLYVGDMVIHDGNADEWSVLNSSNVRRFVALPSRLLACVPRNAKFDFPVQAFADDYWLYQAIERSKGSPGRSPNAWRPHTKAGRTRADSRTPRIKP